MEYILGGFVGDPISLTPEHVEDSFGEVIEVGLKMALRLGRARSSIVVTPHSSMPRGVSGAASALV